MKTTRVFSFSGKGGSGKTTTASLMMAAIIRGRIFRDILVIDADPDANLSRTLRIPVEKTVGQAVDQRRKELKDASAKGTKLRFSLLDSIRHSEAFDFLVMGRTMGDGCYCSVHSALKENLTETMAMYDLVLMDFDAGLEHFSRHSGNPADTLLISCDPSQLSFDTAKRIADLVQELSLPYDHLYLVGCRFPRNMEETFFQMARQTGIEALGIIPDDSEVASRNLSGQDLISIDSENPAFKAADEMLRKLLQPNAMG
jgi:CO dehydrogenase maturation factor